MTTLKARNLMIEVIKSLKETIAALAESIEGCKKHAETSRAAAITFTSEAEKLEKQKLEHVAALDLVETTFCKQATG